MRQWRVSVFHRAEQVKREQCTEAVDRYCSNAQLLGHIFTPPPEGVDGLQRLTDGAWNYLVEPFTAVHQALIPTPRAFMCF